MLAIRYIACRSRHSKKKKQFCSKHRLAITGKCANGQFHLHNPAPTESYDECHGARSHPQSIFTTQKLCLPSACHGARICPADCQPIPVFRLSAGNFDDGSYLGLVGNISQNTGDDTHVHNRQPSMARGPAEVLVAVGVEFYVDQSVHAHERLRGFGPCPDVRAVSRASAPISNLSIAQGPSLHVDLSRSVGSRGTRIGLHIP